MVCRSIPSLVASEVIAFSGFKGVGESGLCRSSVIFIESEAMAVVNRSVRLSGCRGAKSDSLKVENSSVDEMMVDGVAASQRCCKRRIPVPLIVTTTGFDWWHLMRKVSG